MSDFPVTVFHNPACGTSRTVLEMVRAAGHAPEVVEYLKTGWDADQLRGLFAEAGLTPREALVAQLAMCGQTDKEIAKELSLATTSVSKYLRSVLRKAGVVSRGALAERAGVIRLG